MPKRRLPILAIDHDQSLDNLRSSDTVRVKQKQVVMSSEIAVIYIIKF